MHEVIRRRFAHQLMIASTLGIVLASAGSGSAAAAGLGKICGGRLGIPCDRGCSAISTSGHAEASTLRAPVFAFRGSALARLPSARFADAMTIPTQTIVSGSRRSSRSDATVDADQPQSLSGLPPIKDGHAYTMSGLAGASGVCRACGGPGRHIRSADHRPRALVRDAPSRRDDAMLLRFA